MDPATSLSGTGAPGAVLARPGRSRRPAGWRGYAFVAPALLVLIAFLLAPAIWVIGLSFFRWDLISSSADFTGLFNYDRMLHRDPLFWQSLWQTVYFVGVSVPLGMGLGLLLAVLLNARLRGRALFRALMFSPYVTPMVATLVTWEYIFNGDHGVLNSLLGSVGLPRVHWLTDSAAIMPAIIIYSLWQHTGYTTVIFLAGLAQIPAELEDAVRVDGGRAWDVFRHVTWPLLTPTTYFVLLISLIGAFKVFTQSYVLTGGFGGPGNGAYTLGLYLYRQAFVFYRAGYASALSVVLFLIILAVTALQMRVASRRVFYR